MRGSMLKEILQEQGISISELARRLNVSAQTLYSMVKRDNQKVDFDMMMHICKLLNVPVERLCEDNALPKMPDLREWQFIGKYRRLSESSRELVNMVIDHELSRREEKPSVNSPESKIIPLYLTPAAAGYASPALGDDYEDYAVEKGSTADFAVRIAGDSMEPRFHDGQTVWVSQQHSLMTGEIGIFLYDGCAYLKQLVAGDGYLALHSLNPAYPDIRISPALPLRVLGKVLAA